MNTNKKFLNIITLVAFVLIGANATFANDKDDSKENQKTKIITPEYYYWYPNPYMYDNNVIHTIKIKPYRTHKLYKTKGYNYKGYTYDYTGHTFDYKGHGFDYGNSRKNKNPILVPPPHNKPPQMESPQRPPIHKPPHIGGPPIPPPFHH